MAAGEVARAKTASPEARLWRHLARELGVQTVVLFAAAGTLRYWQAWTYLAVRLTTMVMTNVYMIRRDRELLLRRLKLVEEGETQGVHKVFFALVQLLALAIFVVAGLDRRLGWSAAALPLVLGATLVVAAGGLLMFRVFRENTYCSSVIEIGAGQSVVSTGPYRLVRHPMYTGALLGVVATPFALGSYAAAALVPPMVAIFVVRIVAEERFLAVGLPGYAEYMGQTRKRLLPGVW
jgi:protein-S-isoprenylcysteine O-methyltransferase Ste14